MKKVIVLVLALILFAQLTGCTGQFILKNMDKESILICVDIAYADDLIYEDAVEESMNYLMVRLRETALSKGITIPQNIEIEYIPGYGVERETAIDRIRVAVMSGGGPDLFISVCDNKSPTHAEEALFPMPEKIMELGIFLTLDEYMENNTVFAEWDRMNSTVLDAGKSVEGQQIIPLCYTLPLTVFRAVDVEHKASKDITWPDMLHSEDVALTVAAASIRKYTLKSGEQTIAFHPVTEFCLGGIADYCNEELLFTEDELAQRLSELIQLTTDISSGRYDAAPTYYNTYAGYLFTRPNIFGMDSDLLAGIDFKDPHTLIPLYSDDGGVTAEITAYMAINRNTKHPENAFRILDYVMSCKAQRSDWLYENVLYMAGDTASIPMYDELMSEDQRVYQELLTMDGSQSGWYMTDGDFAQLCTIREQITHVKFRDVLDQELTAMYEAYFEAAYTGKDTAPIVTDGYRRIQRILRE